MQHDGISIPQNLYLYLLVDFIERLKRFRALTLHNHGDDNRQRDRREDAGAFQEIGSAPRYGANDVDGKGDQSRRNQH